MSDILFPVAFHKEINAWFVSRHELAAEVLRSPRFSTRLPDWKDAPPPRPADEWTLWDRLQEISMANVGPEQRMRLRRLTAPAFSRRVMDQIEAVRVTNPMYAAERDAYIDGTLPGLQYLLDTIGSRRQADDPGEDFIGTLLATEIDGMRLSDLEILSVISALVTAGADTAVDLHTLAVQALLKHPDQRALLRQRPELMESAILEVLRCSARNKFGADVVGECPTAALRLVGE